MASLYVPPPLSPGPSPAGCRISMRKVKGYQRRDVGVLREQSGRLPVISNDSQFTMFTKRERAIAVQLCRGFEPSFLVVVNVPHATLLPPPLYPPSHPRPLLSPDFRVRTYRSSRLSDPKESRRGRFNIPARNLTQMLGSKCWDLRSIPAQSIRKINCVASLARAFCLRLEFTSPK